MKKKKVLKGFLRVYLEKGAFLGGGPDPIPEGGFAGGGIREPVKKTFQRRGGEKKRGIVKETHSSFSEKK